MTMQRFANPKAENVKKVVLVGFSILALMVGMYVYFVGKIVFDVVGRKTAQASILNLQSSLASNSTSYFQSMKGLDLASAANLGLTPSDDTQYASRPSDGDTAVGMVYNQ